MSTSSLSPLFTDLNAPLFPIVKDRERLVTRGFLIEHYDYKQRPSLDRK